jgi:hypothetical protein
VSRQKAAERKSEEFALGERKLSPLSTVITFYYFSNFFENQH